MARHIQTTLIVLIEDENGQPASDAQVDAAKAATDRAISMRLFGEGYLPDDVMIDAWFIETKEITVG